jgi:hypothetical protein
MVPNIIDRADLVRSLGNSIQANRWPFSPKVRPIRGLPAELDPCLRQYRRWGRRSERAMLVEFRQDETAALIDLLVGTIERHPFPQSPHVQRLRGILEKIRPAPAVPSGAGEETDAPE